MEATSSYTEEVVVTPYIQIGQNIGYVTAFWLSRMLLLPVVFTMSDFVACTE